MPIIQQVDPRESHLHIPSPVPRLRLFLRRLPWQEGSPPHGVMLYVHGGSFASVLSVAYRLPAWRLISLQDQWDRFTADVPPDQPPVLSRRHFAACGEAYLASDAASRERSPPAVKTPSGAFPIFGASAGKLAYDPGLIRAPVAILRGEWDGMCTDADAARLFSAMRHGPIRRDIKLSRATHLMHLEAGRYALYREAATFLRARDEAPAGPGAPAEPWAPAAPEED